MSLPMRIFVSHTSELATMPDGGDMSWVAAADHALSELRHARVHMSLFGARSRRPVDVCVSELRQCQVWIGILGARYGSIEARSQVSYTELEFNTAKESGLRLLAFVLDPSAPVAAKDDVPGGAARQEDFKKNVSDCGLVKKKVSKPTDLFTGVYDAIRNLDDVRPKPQFLHEPRSVIPNPLRGRHAERDALRRSLEDNAHRVVALVGARGSGKTALAATLLHDLLDADPESYAIFRFLDYASAAGLTPVTGPFLLLRLLEAALLGPERTRLERCIRDNPATWTDQVEDVLDLIADPVLLVLDEAENLLDLDGRFYDRQLDRLVQRLSLRDDHLVTLLIVSATCPSAMLIGHHHGALQRVPRTLDHDTDAADLLSDMAQRAKVRLPMSASAMVSIVGRRPRSLELAVAALALAPASGECLAQVFRFPSDQGDHSLHLLLDQMPDDELAAIRVLAVLGLPSAAADVAEIMKSVMPADLTSNHVVVILRRLSSCQLVHTEVRNGTTKYFLPVEEAGHFLDDWRRDSVGDHGYQQLVRVVANHLALRKGQIIPRRVEELVVHFREIALRMQLGGQAERCLWLMNDLDRAYLHSWGHAHVLMRWRRELLDVVQDDLWRHNVSSLAVGAAEIGELDEAGRLMRQLRTSLATGPVIRADAADDLVRTEVQTLDLAAGVAFYDGRMFESRDWYMLELQVARHPYDRLRALNGLGRCAKDLGQLDEAKHRLSAAAELCADVDADQYDSARAELLLTQSDLARIHGDPMAIQLAQEAVAAASGTDNAVLRIRIRDLLTSLRMEQCVYERASNELFLSALNESTDAAEQAARTGLVDITRTIHAVLAFSRLHQGDLGAARAAATSAARYFRSKRGLPGQLALGVVEFRDRRKAGSEWRARDAFWEAIRMANQFPPDHGRPFWVWDSLGVAFAGLYLCRVDGAFRQMQTAFLEARRCTSAKGAIRRTTFYLDALTADASTDVSQAILAAVRKTASQQ